MTADTMEVQKALTMLVYQFALSANAESSLREQSFGSSFNGLQMMNCDKQSVRNLLVLLNHLLIKSNFTSAQPTTIASVFSGLRSMTTWCEELGTLVETLASMLYKLNTTLTNDTVGQVLGGLRHFSDTQLPTRKLLAAIARSIQRSDIKFTPESLSYCMLGLKSMTGVSIEYTQLIEAINARLALSHASDASVAATNGVKLTSTEISRIFYGLQETSLYKKPALQSLLSVVHEWLSASDETVFSGRDVGMTLYGFKSQSYKERIPLVISLLATLTNKVSPAPSDKPRPNTFYFNAQSASMAFMGLQSLNGSTAVYAIIDAIIPRIAELDQRGASTILFSLRHLSSSHPTTCKLIAKLVPLMRSVHHLTSQEIANSLWGLQGMDGRVTEVAQLFEIVAALLEEIPSTVTFSGPEISMAISGLQSCGDECPAVIKILGLLADRLESCSDKLRSFEIANILFGLQGMSGEHDACRAVLVALLPKMKECIAPFSARDIAFSMVGLSTMQPSAVTFSEIWLVLEELNLKFSQSEIKGATQLDFSVFGKGIKLKSNAVE